MNSNVNSSQVRQCFTVYPKSFTTVFCNPNFTKTCEFQPLIAVTAGFCIAAQSSAWLANGHKIQDYLHHNTFLFPLLQRGRKISYLRLKTACCGALWCDFIMPDKYPIHWKLVFTCDSTPILWPTKQHHSLLAVHVHRKQKTVTKMLQINRSFRNYLLTLCYKRAKLDRCQSK